MPQMKNLLVDVRCCRIKTYASRGRPGLTQVLTD